MLDGVPRAKSAARRERSDALTGAAATAAATATAATPAAALELSAATGFTAERLARAGRTPALADTDERIASAIV